MNTKQIPVQSVTKQGLLHGNVEHKQLRLSFGSGPEKQAWYEPISCYRAGKTIKRGQPVSIGFKDELGASVNVLSGEPCIVPCDPKRHNWCIGIALEPGGPDIVPGPDITDTYIHVLSSGKLTYNINDKRNQNDLYMPPKNSSGKFIWTYDDIGKSVYVSNVAGQVGELTLNITEAYADGANIISVGHLADAPTQSGIGENIVIEVQLDGDNRGLIDSTEFDVELLDWSDTDGQPPDPINDPIISGSSRDRIVCVKIVDYKNSIPRGKMILSDKDLLEAGATNSPVGAFIAESGVSYHGKTVLVHRLGILEGHAGHEFGFNSQDFGKDVYLSEGNLITTGSDDDFEYKVGVIMNSNRILIDCRYARIFNKFEPIGKIQPIYGGVDGSSNVIELCNPGYMKMDNEKGIPVRANPGDQDEDKRRGYYDEATDTGLFKVILHSDIAEFFDHNPPPEGTGQKISITANDTAADIYNTYNDIHFRFKNTIYSIGDRSVAAQIKFSSEGNPDSMQYIWPSKVFSVELTKDNSTGNSISKSLLEFDVTDLVKLGETYGGNNNLADDYEVTFLLVNQEDKERNVLVDLRNQTLSSGYYIVNVETTISTPTGTQDANGNNIMDTTIRSIPWLCGYEWIINYKKNVDIPERSGYRLSIVTDPEFLADPLTNPLDPYDPNNPITKDHVKGICYPPGHAITENGPIWVVLLVRRRPTFYHNLLLNQIWNNSGWRLITDGNNLNSRTGRLYFGGDPTGTVPDGTKPFDTISIINPTKASSVFMGDTNDQLRPALGDKITKLLQFIYAPLFEEVPLGKVDDIQIGVEQHQRKEKDPGNGGSPGKSLEWYYYFEEAYISSNAPIKAFFYTKTTGTKNFLTEITSENAYFTDEYPRYAMQTLREIPTWVYHYNNNDAMPPKNKFYGPTYASMHPDGQQGQSEDYFQPQAAIRYIFKNITGNPDTTMSSLKYRYDNTEWGLMENQYKSLLGEDQNAINVQTGLGLLIRGARETQDRLYKLERTIFGPYNDSFPSLLKEDAKSAEEKFNKGGFSHYSLQTLAGVNRLLAGISKGYDELTADGYLSNHLLVDTEKTGFTWEGMPEGRSIITLFEDLWYELEGSYVNLEKPLDYGHYPQFIPEEEYVTKPHGLIGKGSDPLHKPLIFHKVLYWYSVHQMDAIKEGIKNTSNKPMDATTNSNSFLSRGMHSAKDIYIERIENGWRETFVEGSYNRTDWPWPMGRETIDKDTFVDNRVVDILGLIPPSVAFYYPSGFGLSDDLYDSTLNSADNQIATSSVEGFLYDICLKLSYLRNIFDTDQQSIKPEYSMLASTQFIDLNHAKVPGFKDPVAFTDAPTLRQILRTPRPDDEYVLGSSLGIPKTYSLFGFTGGKFSKFAHLLIEDSIYPVKYVTNVTEDELRPIQGKDLWIISQDITDPEKLAPNDLNLNLTENLEEPTSKINEAIKFSHIDSRGQEDLDPESTIDLSRKIISKIIPGYAYAFYNGENSGYDGTTDDNSRDISNVLSSISVDEEVTIPEEMVPVFTMPTESLSFLIALNETPITIIKFGLKTDLQFPDGPEFKTKASLGPNTVQIIPTINELTKEAKLTNVLTGNEISGANYSSLAYSTNVTVKTIDFNGSNSDTKHFDYYAIKGYNYAFDATWDDSCNDPERYNRTSPDLEKCDPFQILASLSNKTDSSIAIGKYSLKCKYDSEEADYKNSRQYSKIKLDFTGLPYEYKRLVLLDEAIDYTDLATYQYWNLMMMPLKERHSNEYLILSPLYNTEDNLTNFFESEFSIKDHEIDSKMAYMPIIKNDGESTKDAKNRIEKTIKSVYTLESNDCPNIEMEDLKIEVEKLGPRIKVLRDFGGSELACITYGINYSDSKYNISFQKADYAWSDDPEWEDTNIDFNIVKSSNEELVINLDWDEFPSDNIFYRIVIKDGKNIIASDTLRMHNWDGQEETDLEYIDRWSNDDWGGYNGKKLFGIRLKFGETHPDPGEYPSLKIRWQTAEYNANNAINWADGSLVDIHWDEDSGEYRTDDGSIQISFYGYQGLDLDNDNYMVRALILKPDNSFLGQTAVVKVPLEAFIGKEDLFYKEWALYSLDIEKLNSIMLSRRADLVLDLYDGAVSQEEDVYKFECTNSLKANKRQHADLSEIDNPVSSALAIIELSASRTTGLSGPITFIDGGSPETENISGNIKFNKVFIDDPKVTLQEEFMDKDDPEYGELDGKFNVTCSDIVFTQGDAWEKTFTEADLTLTTTGPIPPELTLLPVVFKIEGLINYSRPENSQFRVIDHTSFGIEYGTNHYVLNITDSSISAVIKNGNLLVLSCNSLASKDLNSGRHLTGYLNISKTKLLIEGNATLSEPANGKYSLDLSQLDISYWGDNEAEYIPIDGESKPIDISGMFIPDPAAQWLKTSHEVESSPFVKRGEIKIRKDTITIGGNNYSIPAKTIDYQMVLPLQKIFQKLENIPVVGFTKANVPLELSLKGSLDTNKHCFNFQLEGEFGSKNEDYDTAAEVTDSDNTETTVNSGNFINTLLEINNFVIRKDEIPKIDIIMSDESYVTLNGKKHIVPLLELKSHTGSHLYRPSEMSPP